MNCEKCQKLDDHILEFVSDFHGNSIGWFCTDCLPKVNKLLDIVFFGYGGEKAKNNTVICAPSGSPHIQSYQKLKITVYTIRYEITSEAVAAGLQAFWSTLNQYLETPKGSFDDAAFELEYEATRIVTKYLKSSLELED
jgi:hypothetical protein